MQEILLMSALIRGQSCRNCKFSHPCPDTLEWLECRAHPPNFCPVAVPIKPGVMGLQIHGGPGRVSPDYFCGEHKPRLCVVENQETIPAAAFDQAKLAFEKKA